MVLRDVRLFLALCFSDAVGAALLPAATVVVMRHCVRSTPNDGILAVPGFGHFDQYSEKPWPNFPAPTWYCLPRGEHLVEGQGRWLRQSGGLPQPVRALADDMQQGQRDNVTMHRFLIGLGIDGTATATIDRRPFVPSTSEACAQVQPSQAEMEASMRELMAANPVPKEFASYLQELYEILGSGDAGNWTGRGCEASLLAGPIPAGACQAAAEFTERLLMQLGGGMEVGWGRVSEDDVAKLLAMHRWHFHSQFVPPMISKYKGASMASAVLSALEEARGGTLLLVGHDSDLMTLNAILGLGWDARPFPVNATLPGSFLRFDRIGDQVAASYSFIANFSDSSGALTSVPANFSTDSHLYNNRIALTDFRARVVQRSLTVCANSIDADASPATHVV